MPYGTAIYYSKDGNDCIIFKNTLKLQDYRGSKIMTYEVKKYDNVISIETRKQIARRYHRIIEIVNREFWSMDNDTAHGLYVGSYGRGTAIDTSDIDMLVENVYRDRIDRTNFYKQFITFGIALYFLVLLVQLLLGSDSYLQLLEQWYVVILLHGVILINTYFLVSGIRYYHEDVGAE